MSLVSICSIGYWGTSYGAEISLDNCFSATSGPMSRLAIWRILSPSICRLSVRKGAGLSDPETKEKINLKQEYFGIFWNIQGDNYFTNTSNSQFPSQVMDWREKTASIKYKEIFLSDIRTTEIQGFLSNCHFRVFTLYPQSRFQGFDF